MFTLTLAKFDANSTNPVGQPFHEQTPWAVFRVKDLCHVKTSALYRHLFDVLAGSVIMTHNLHSGVFHGKLPGYKSSLTMFILV